MTIYTVKISVVLNNHSYYAYLYLVVIYINMLININMLIYTWQLFILGSNFSHYAYLY